MTASVYRYYIMLVVTMIFFGGSWVSAKYVVNLAPGLTLTVGFLRFLVASVFFMIILYIKDSRKVWVFRKGNLRILFLVGLTGVFGYGVFFLVGMNFTTAAQGSIIAGINPVTISVFAHLIHHERLARKWQYSGFVMAFIGVVFVVGIQALMELNIAHIIGNLLILMAMVTWGLYSSIAKEAMKTQTPLEVNTGGAIVGSALFGIGAVNEKFWNHPAMFEPSFWLNIMYLGIFVTVIGFLFYFISIKEIGATRAGGFINLVPVFGVLLSALIMPEDAIYWTFGVGLFLVVLGISIVNYPVESKAGMSMQDAEES